MRYINLNGKLVEEQFAAVPYDNRAFRYSYGLFETILVRDDSIQLARYHWERLFAGAKALNINITKLLTVKQLEEEVLRTVKKNSLEKLCRVRLQLYAGRGGILDEQEPPAEYIIECFPLEQHIIELNEHGLTIGIAKSIYKSNDSLANHKTTNALVYAMAAQHAKTNKWNDALVLNQHGNIIESTIANIFWIENDIIHTPPLSEGCIAGVMRRYILEKVSVVEKALTEQILLNADAVFLTNAIRKIKWVENIADKTYSKKGIQSLYSQLFS
ncbi:MAG: aminotransferase class IV [Bacteroidetes bacterium]|nr:aminotransferase class IV [Bacteroidota bacterium]